MRIGIIQRCWMVAALLTVCGPVFADATLSTLYQFQPLVPLGTQINADGAGVAALIEDSPGNLYGVTLEGGSTGSGTVFQVSPSGSLTTLYLFSAAPGNRNPDGANPSSLVRDASGNLYGTTSAGGSNGGGTVFKISGGVFSVLYAFEPLSDGMQAGAVILGQDGNLYGVALRSGAGNAGTVFRISPDGDFAVIYAFAAMDVGTRANADGGSPVSIVQAADGSFYGSTSEGGPNGTGTVFRLTISGGLTSVTTTLTTLYAFGPCAYCFFLGTTTDGSLRFANADGAWPTGLMLARDGNLYGTTGVGGSSGNGTVFRLSPTGAFTSLHQFAGGTDGANPAAPPVEGSDGVLLGTSGSVIYRVDMSTGTTVPLYAASSVNFEGMLPSIADPAGKFYVAGGTSGTSPTSSIFALTTTTAPIGQTAQGGGGGGGGALAGSELLALGCYAAFRLNRRNRKPS
jgi:uncharacterized repeat protein (TIGR03803 family)